MSAAERRLAGPRIGRGNLWLAALAVVQVGLLILVLLTVARPPVLSKGPLLGKDVTPSSITAFTVTGSNGKSVSLKRSGIDWVLPEMGGYPAQASRVKSFLQKLTALQRSGLVATTKDAYKRLKVTSSTFQRKIALTLKGGKTETLYIGSEPSYGSTHVRLASDSGVYVTHSLHASDARTDAAGYVNTTALNLSSAKVTRMEVKNANGDFVFTQGKNGWSMKGLASGKKLDSQKVSSLAGSLTDLQLNEPLGKTAKPAYGLANPTAVVTLTTVTPAKTGKGAAKNSSGGSTTSTGSSGGSGKAASSATGSGASGSATSGSSAGSAAGSATAASGTSKPVTTTTTLTVGKKDKAGFYPLRISSSPYLVRVTSAALGGAMSKKASDFIVQPKKKSSGASGAGGAVSGLRSLQPPAGSGGTTGQ